MGLTLLHRWRAKTRGFPIPRNRVLEPAGAAAKETIQVDGGEVYRAAWLAARQEEICPHQLEEKVDKRRRWWRTWVEGEDRGGDGEGVTSRALSAYRESKLCLAYARTNPSICASFLPWMATTSFQGRSRRDPPLTVAGMDFSRAPNSAPSIIGGHGALHRGSKKKQCASIGNALGFLRVH